MSGRLGCLVQELARFVATLLSVALIFLIPLVVYAAVLDRTMLNPDFYKASLARHDAYTDLPPELVDEVVQRTLVQAAPAGVRSLFNDVGEEDWRPIVRAVAPPEWLRGVIEGNIDALFAWMGGSDPYPRIPIPVGPIRDRLRTGPGGRQLVNVLLRDQPPCTPQQLQAILSASGVASCAPPPDALDRITVLLLPQIDNFIGQIITSIEPGADPAAREVDLAAAIRARVGGEELFQRLRTVRSLANTIQLAPPLGMAMILLFLGLVHLLAVRNWQGWAQWLGLLMFLAGGLALIPLLLVPAWLNQTLAELAARPMSDRPLLAIVHIQQWLVEDFSAEMVRTAGIASGGMILLGLLLLILSIFLPAGQPETFEEGAEDEESGRPSSAAGRPSYDDRRRTTGGGR